LQSNTQLSVQDKQAASAQAIAQWNNQNALNLANMNNAAALQNIQANGQISMQVNQINNANKTLLQTSQGAAQMYSQALQNLSAIMTNTNLTTAQQQTALNNQVKQLQDGLQVMNSIAGNQQAMSLLNFSDPGAAPAAAPGAPQPAAAGPAAATAGRAPIPGVQPGSFGDEFFRGFGFT
jgi:hypothetical protein